MKLFKWSIGPILLLLMITGLYYWSYQRLLTGQDQHDFQLSKVIVQHNSTDDQTSSKQRPPQINSATTNDLVQARIKFMTTIKQSGLGVLMIPDVNLKLPIFKMATMTTLSSGVARYFPDRPLLTSGNQVLIAHNFDGADVLLSRINRLKSGNYIYLTDLTTIAKYRVTTNKVINQRQTTVLADTEKPEVTLIRCESGANTVWRRVVIGELVSKKPYRKSTVFFEDSQDKQRKSMAKITMVKAAVSRQIFAPKTEIVIFVSFILVSIFCIGGYLHDLNVN